MNNGLFGEILLFSLLALLLAFSVIYGRRVLRLVFYPIALLLRGVIRIFRGLARVLRFAAKPVTRPIRGVARRLPSAAAQVGQEAGAASVWVREQPWQMLLHLLDARTRSELALGEVPVEVRNKVKRQGLYFHWINPNETLDLLKETRPFDDASKGLDEASVFYKREVDHEISPSSLYEDAESAFIIETFRESDQAFFYVLRKIQNTATRNIVKYIGIVSAALFVALFALIDYATYVIESAPWSGKPPMQALQATAIMAAWLLVPLAVLVIMKLLRYVYQNSERNNGQKLNYFVQTYLNRIRQQYQASLTSLSQGLQDAAYNETEIGSRSKVWYVNFQWLALRTFFLELFVRNFMFHVRRNAFWFSVFIPAMVLVLLSVVFLVFLDLAPAPESSLMLFGIDLGKPDPHLGVVFVLTIVAMVLGYLHFLGGMLLIFRGEISRDTWPRFAGMDLMAHMEEIVEDDKREIVSWRRRIGRASGV